MKLYSKKYLNNLKKLHETRDSFGSKASELNKIKYIISTYDVKSILDYGCGKGKLIKTIKSLYPNIISTGYDPGNQEFSNKPTQHELVSCVDVLEHVEPNLLDNVIKHLDSLSEKFLYLEISCFPAKTLLPDGKNAHLTIQSPEWWKSKLINYFNKDNFLFERIVDKGKKRIREEDINLIFYRVLIKK